MSNEQRIGRVLYNHEYMPYFGSITSIGFSAFTLLCYFDKRNYYTILDEPIAGPVCLLLAIIFLLVEIMHGRKEAGTGLLADVLKFEWCNEALVELKRRISRNNEKLALLDIHVVAKIQEKFYLSEKVREKERLVGEINNL